MGFNYNKLKGRIIEVWGSQKAFAHAMGVSEKTISNKLCGKKAWSQDEICLSIEVLGLSAKDIPDYFFTTKVQ